MTHLCPHTTGKYNWARARVAPENVTLGVTQ